WNSLVRGSPRRSERLAARVSRSTGIRIKRVSCLRHAALFGFARVILWGFSQSRIVFTRRSAANVERSLFSYANISAILNRSPRNQKTAQRQGARSVRSRQDTPLRRHGSDVRL